MIRAGMILFIISIYPGILMTRELVVAQRTYGRFRLERIPTNEHGFFDDSLQADISGHHVDLRDNLGPSQDHEARAIGMARISIDGHDYSSQTAVAIRPYFADQNRYHGWVRLIRLVDTRTNSSRLVVAQRIAPPAMGADDTIPNRPALRYRILFIGANGEVIEDVFSYRERGHPPIRAMIANLVSPFSIGIYSEVFQVGPNVIYPVVYPGLTGIAGLVLCISGLARRFRRVRRLDAASA